MSGRTFTTYFKGEVDTSVEGKINAQASTVVSAYNRMALAAQNASRAGGLIGGSGSAGLNVTRALTAQADAQRRISDNTLAAVSSTTRFQQANAAAGRASAVAAVQNDALALSLGRASTALGVIQGPLGPIAGRVRALSGALKEFSVSSLGLVGVAGALFGIVAIGNQYTAVVTKLRPFFETQQQTNQALAEVVGIANGARSALEPIADLFVRLTTLQKEFRPGTNIDQLASTIAKASTLSGGTAENQAEGIRQLTQGLGRGILNGQDLRALEEDSFNLAKTIADGLGVNVGKLKQLGAEGKLTTDVVIQALQREQYVVEAQFARLPVTLSSASREFKNALITLVGGTDQAVGITNSLAEALQAVAQNIRPITAVGVALAAAFTVPRAGAALVGFIDSVTAKLAAQNAIAKQTDAAVAAGTAYRTDALGKASAVASAELDGAIKAHEAAVIRREDSAANVAFTKLEQEETLAKIASTESLQSAVIEEAQAEVAAAREVLTQRQAAFGAFVEEIAERIALEEQYAVAAEAAAKRVARAKTPQAAEEAGADLARISAGQAANQARLEEIAALQEAVTTAEANYQAALARSAAATEQVQGETAALASARAALLEITIPALAAEYELIAALEAEAEAELLVAKRAEEAAAARNLAAASQFEAKLASGIGLIFNWQTAILAATAALIYYATKTDEVDTALKNLNETHRQAIEAEGRHADSLTRLGKAGAQAAADLERAQQAQAQQASNDARDKIVKDLRTAAGTNFGAKRQQLSDLADQVALSRDAGKITELVNTARKIDPANLSAASQSTSGLSGAIGSVRRFFGTDPTDITKHLGDLARSTEILRDANDELTAAQTAANTSGNQQAIVLGRQSASVKDLQTQAQALVDTGRATVDENNKFAASVAALNTKFGVSKGKIGEDGTVNDAAVGDAKGYQNAYQALYAAHQSRLKQIQTERTASHAAATEAKQDALGALQDATLNALIDLEKRKGSLTEDEYLAQRLAIKKRYDDEKAAIDSTGSRSHTALQQQLQDIQAIAKAAEEAGNKRDTILGRYSSQPKPEVQRQKDLADLKANIGRSVEFTRGDSTSVRIYTEDDFDKDSKNLDAVGRELTKFYAQQRQTNAVSILQASGQEALANAIPQAFQYEQQFGAVSAERLNGLIEEAQQQLRINDLLNDRRRITDTLTSAAGELRDITATFIENLSGGNVGGAFTGLFRSIQQQQTRALATKISTGLFAGADQTTRNLLNPQSAVDQARQLFADSVDRMKSSTDRAADALNGLADRVTQTNIGGTTADGFSTSVGDGASNSVSVLSGLGGGSAGGLLAAAAGAGVAAASNDNTLSDPNVIRVVADPLRKISNSLGSLPSIIDVQNGVGAAAGKNAANDIKGALSSLGLGKLGDTVGDKIGAAVQFIGKNLGNAVQGATIGATAGSLIFGNSQSAAGKLGDKIGGAIGNVAGKALGGADGVITKGLTSVLGKGLGSALGSAVPVIGSVLGSIAGGLLGGLFAKKVIGAATVSFDQYGNGSTTTSGTSGKANAAATGDAKSVITGIQSVASTLGAQILAGSGVTIGTYQGKYRVNTQGTKLGGSSSPVPGLTDFGSDEQAAINYAIQASIQKGVITGISQASINILKSGQDLQIALQKALSIENIPKQLEQLTNPVAYAVHTLNDQFTTLISNLNEGGATAEQFAQAQQLYDLQRAAAVTAAAKSVFGTVEDYIKSLTDSTDSPLNKRTTYQNAKSTFDALASQIDAGKLVDQNDLVTAAKNLQSASSGLNGSDTNFFADFNRILTELNKADAIATAGVNTTAASADGIASPFATDATAAAALASLKAQGTTDTQAQTAALLSGIATLTTTVAALNTGSASTSVGAISRLTGVNAK